MGEITPTSARVKVKEVVVKVEDSEVRVAEVVALLAVSEVEDVDAGRREVEIIIRGIRH